MVTYIRSDLDFILTQIKIAEAHAAGQPLYGVDGALIPTYNLAWGLRTVDGSYNNLLHPTWGAADQEFPEHLGTVFRPAAGTPLDMDGPGPAPAMPTAPNYNPSTDPNSIVVDPSLRTISNLIVDQTLGNPSAILTGLQRAGIVAAGSQITVTQQITALYEPLKPLFNAVNTAARVNAEAQAAASASPGNAALQQAAATAAANLLASETALDAADDALVTLLTSSGIELDGANIVITNAAPDEGLSAPFNSWFTLFGQFFDHGLDLIAKGGAGTVFIPLLPDDPLYDPTSPTNFMVLTRATNIGPGKDGILVDNPATAINEAADNTDRPVNTTTPFVDQNQTYSSHPSHQVFLRQYVLNGAGDPVSTGKLMEGGNGGMATWGELKVQAATLLGIQLLDVNVGNIPLLATDQYGNFIPGTNGFPQIVTATGLVEGNPAANGGLGVLVPANAFFTGHAFLADIAHNAVPDGLADGDIEIGLNNPGFEPGAYDDELLDAHYVAGDGRANENIGLTAVHHVFHAEHNRLVEHTKEVVIADANAMLLDGATPAAAVAFLNEWLINDVAAVPATGAGLIWDGERLFQAAKFGTEMQYQHLVFEEFARKIQPNINVFLVPDGYDVTIDPSIVAEFAHVIYRFGHSMLTETIDRFDPTFTPDQIGLIEGFLNPIQFANNGGDTLVEDGISAGAIIRGMTRQAGNEIDEFVTSALRNNLLGLPLDLATINLARGRDTGVPSLNEARSQFYEATNHDALLKPYESWVDFAGHLKHEASIINFIAAYGTHATILAADTIEEKRDAAMALVGLTSGSGGTGSTAVVISNASFEADSLASGGPGVIADPLGNYTTTAPTGWTMTGTGGMFAPAAGVTNLVGIQGTNVVWLSQDTMLARDTGVVLAAGASYSLTFDIGDRTDMAWPGGVARLVSSDGTLLATQLLAAPADGDWSTITFQTGAIAAGALVGQTLRIEIQQTGGTGNQILVDDIQLNVLQPLPPQTPLDEVDRQAFLNGTGQYATDLGGLNLVDLWIGGLAEEIMPFGGMLGSTFNFVFETQMEKLQNGDRFYYLQRLDGLHLFGEMENNSFAAMIMRNTDATHLPSDVFSTPGLILEVDQTRQFNDLDGDGDLETTDPVGEGILTQLVIRNDPATSGPDTNYLKYTGGDHVVLGGTNNNDTLIAGIGDDTLFGDAGNDRLEGGFGNDIINGGDGDDIIVDSGGDDNIKAGKGNDVVHAGPGLDLVMGNDGQDFIFLGTDMGSEVFAGTGNDFIYGNKNAERILGNEGNDWIETGTFDGAPGDNFDEIFSHDAINGHDVFLGDGGFDEFIGEGGDDIFVGSAGRGKMVGMSGFDWATYKDNPNFVNADLSIPIVFDEAPTLPQNASLDEYESVEGLSGTKGNDILTGTDMLAADRLPTLQGGTEGYQGSALAAEGIALINGLQALLGAGVTSFSAGDIILGGDGSDLIMGKAGDDIIDGDKWLDVQIGVFAPTDVNHTGTPIALHNSMTTLAASMFDGTINPGQLSIVRTIRTDTTSGDIDVARYQGARADYTFGATADGRITVTDVTELNLDGSDTLSGIERLQFTDGTVGLIVGTAGNDVLNGTTGDDLMLGLGGNDVLNAGDGNDILVGGPNTAGVSGSYADNFNDTALNNSNGATPWAATPWIETGDNGGTNSASAGQIRIDDGTNELRLRDDDNDTGNGTATITRNLNLSGATTATISYAYNESGFDAGETVTVLFAADGVNFNQTIQTITGATNTGSITNALLNGPFGANSAIRFVVAGTNNNGDFVGINDLTIAFTGATETLNGGAGNDTYVINLGDGIDVINETSGIDRITVGGTVPPALPAALTGLNMFEVTAGGGNDDLVIQFNGQQVTVTDHFDTAGEAVEFINFNGSTFENYILTGDYALSTDDNDPRTAAAGVNTALAGSTGGDTLTGNDGFDLLFGHDGNDNLNGGLGEDLLVGGTGNDTLNGGDDLDTLVGGAGNDTYVDDNAEDVIVEAAGAAGGVDTVETLAAAYSLAALADVENLIYTGIDADQFVGTGNAGNNVITGGDLADTLTGLSGDDTLDGGLGADTMIGGLNNDVYFVDDAGDVVTELAGGGIDRVESTVDYTLGTEVDNLDLNGAAVVGRGNALANVINGNGAANQLFGGGGTDTLNGDDGNDVLDGGDGNDTLNGGDDDDTIIGGAGNDTIDVGTGFNTIVYNATGFGADIINSFDATGGTPANQDRIDLSGLGVTAANFANRVFESANGANTIITIRENGPASAIQGTIQINGVNNAGIDVSDFTLAVPGNVITGTGAGATHNGTAAADTINALGGNDTVNAGAGNDIVNGGTGNDTLNGDAGDDTFNWNANTATAASLVNSDGRDIVNGGAEGGAGDTFVITGNAAVAETYRIYTRAAWDALAGNNGGNLNAATEIVVTRGTNTDFANSVIAELREIEEIRINSAEPSASGTAGGDTFQVIGDFSGTSLRLNTITIDGDAGDDTIDISALTSAHRIVFKSNGGHDTIVGTLRPQDVIELPAGTTPDDYVTTTDENGVTTMTSANHSIRFTSEGGLPEFAGTDDGGTDDGGDDDVEAPPPNPTPPTPVATTGALIAGTALSNVLIGTASGETIVALAGNDTVIGDGGADVVRADEGDDFVSAGDGNDMAFGGDGNDDMFGGDGNDMLYGDAGSDRIFGDAGNDMIHAGAGNDIAYGGTGNDMFVAGANDGDDIYYGDADIDTLDMSSITANLNVDIGSGFMGQGSASSSQSGHDTLWGFENIVTGAGNDTITANASVNIIEGGAGADTFRFLSEAAADGDTITSFQAGDKIDLSGADADSGLAGNQAFTLVSGSTLSGPAQIAVSHETREDGDYTVVSGSVDSDATAEFRLNIKGNHNLTSTDFNL